MSDEAQSQPKVLFINNSGGGFADEVAIGEGMNISSFFKEHMGNENPASFVIRVNRNYVRSDYILQDGDKISITPNKVQGAL